MQVLSLGRIGIWTCWLLWKEKKEKPERNLRSKAGNNNKLNPHACMAVVVGERFHHCAIPAPLISSGNPSRAIFRSIPVSEMPGESRNHVTRVLHGSGFVRIFVNARNNISRGRPECHV